MEQPKTLVYPRDTSLDPQLVWKGKDEQDSSGLVVDAPPIYIQEKIDPRVLIENLRKTALEGEGEPDGVLFEMFDGLDEYSAVDFYHHDANWSNRMILGDSLQVMGSLAERENLRGQVQMVYIDPPYGIKFGSNWQVSARQRDVSDGKLSDTVREAEQVKAFRDTWELGIHSYLAYLRDRLITARDLLANSGSVFVQIGDENVHLVRNLMDEVFGAENWISTIVVSKTSSATGDFIGGTVDYVHWFAKNKEIVKHRQLFRKKIGGGDGAGMYTRVELPSGERRSLTAPERQDMSLIPEGARLFRHDNLTSQSMGREKGEGAASWFPVEVEGKVFRPSMQARWKTNEEGMRRLLAAGRVAAGRNMPAYVRYLDDFPAFPYTEVWSDIGGARDKNYVVETATTIIERCMLMSTDPGDLILDPTCGSGTSAFVAEQWGRRWITIDTSRVALALARQRLMGAKFPYYLMSDSMDGRKKEMALSGKPSASGPVTNNVRHGFVYKRIPHITLRAIANNPDVKEGMERKDIDAIIRRHADFEVLVDDPFEDKRKVRVSGPFTVESLTPHRSLTFEEGSKQQSKPSSSGRQASASLVDDTPFEQSILDNLFKAGIQNGRKAERLVFSSLDMYPGTFMQAVATSTETTGESRIGLAIGPQYGTVSPTFIKKAAREAIEADDIDVLCVLGFAFDPRATNVTHDDGVTVDASSAGFAEVAGQRKLGKVNVLFVRMNSDLLMGADLKKTGAGNLFTVFGEPDIEVIHDVDVVTVHLKGIDVFDPTTGEVRSGGTDKVALWMIDTNYNEESFFVRHCYFTGGGDPLKKLRNTLKAEINAEAWDSLYSTISRPFNRAETGKIAVKVINDYGDEVMKVFEV
ncbi:site-specific DNA-methyltransferase [Pseudarthrobacter defluvii]|uniref:site-specific DNA-methyltransferase n=1 Tax=Pseudarthrobacter defluvii TaxID=410837 RepID=UPI0027D88FC8|nr:site-specific DNA-methyltransferase [Pseudarthrobacter defluvii]